MPDQHFHPGELFADFDGNGAFMSLGNLLLNPQVGCLFIDFSDGGRLRINGRAEIYDSGPILEHFAAAARAVLVTVEQVVPNCSKHVPRLVTPAASALPVPGGAGETMP